MSQLKDRFEEVILYHREWDKKYEHDLEKSRIKWSSHAFNSKSGGQQSTEYLKEVMVWRFLNWWKTPIYKFRKLSDSQIKKIKTNLP